MIWSDRKRAVIATLRAVRGRSKIGLWELWERWEKKKKKEGEESERKMQRELGIRSRDKR
jgi:hypothetical protein